MRRRSKKFLYFIAFILFITSYISSSFIFAYYRDVYLPELFRCITDIMSDNISCYGENSKNRFANDSLRNPNSIFFYQTNCKKALSLREACSIEAAATLHRNRKVYVLFANEPDVANIVIKEVLKIPNVIIGGINVYKFAEDTPFNALIEDATGQEKRRFNVVAKLLKLITLYKFGGAALDLDVILSKSINALGDNWVLKDGNDYSMTVLKLTYDIIGQAIAGMVLSNIRKQIGQTSINEEKAIKEALEEFCIVPSRNMSKRICNGINIHDHGLFHPISYSNRHLYFKPGTFYDTVYGYQTWNRNVRQSISGNSLYAKLARTYCPKIFSIFMYDFVTDN